jgi:hypothetical protein
VSFGGSYTCGGRGDWVVPDGGMYRR